MHDFLTKKPKLNGKVIAMILISVMTLSVLLIALPSKADNLFDHTTYILAAGAPNPIGVGQTAYLTYLIENPPPPVIPANAPHYFFWSGITLTITQPDGTVKNITDLQTSYAGAGTVSYVPTQVGTYTLVASFPGETIPSGPSAGQYFEPSISKPATFTVTNEPAQQTAFPLPSSYFTYPIESENTAWATYAGNWLAGNLANASQTSVWNPYSAGPYSSHVMWSMPWTTGGLVGGSYQSQQYSFGRWPGGSNQYFSPFIANGIMYVNLPQYFTNVSGASQPAGFEAINLATDKVLWTQTAYNDSLSYLEILYYSQSTMAQGTTSMLWDTSGSTWRLFDPLTGNLVQTITGAASGGKVTFGPNGELMIYYINANGWLAAWNSTTFEQAIGQVTNWANSQINTPNIVYVVPQGTYNFTLGYQWNVTIPKQPGIGFTNGVFPNDLLVCSSSIAATNTSTTMLQQIAFSIKPNQYSSAPLNIQGLGALQSATGNQAAQVLWGPVNRTTFIDNVGYERIETGGYTNDGTPAFVMYPRQTLSATVYNARTGQLMYNTQPFNNTFASFSGESNNLQIADGKLFICGYDGTLWAYDLESGNLLWSYYVGNAGLDTPYGTWPIDGSYSYYTIAGGVVYMGANEHSPGDPTWIGGQIWAVNDTSGKLLWKIDSIQDETQPIAVADSQAIYLNYYDGKLYDIGQGPSATTILAPQVSIMAGQAVTITGTVMDKAIGATQPQQIGNFPNGLPCVSDDSMNDWMNYVYMQKPMPTNTTGVQVTLTAIDPNHNLIPLGSTTTDSSGNYGFIWTTPNIPGAYQIKATFSGTNSYWGSSDTTYLNTVEQPTATVQPTPIPQSSADMYFIPSIVAVIVVMIIGFALMALLTLRKRP